MADDGLAAAGVATPPPLASRARKVVIATPFYGSPPVQYLQSLQVTTDVLARLGRAYDFVMLPGDTYVHRARNAILLDFLQGDATDLFMIDSDIAWDARDFLRVLDAPHDVVAALYRQKNDWGIWTGAHLGGEGGTMQRDEAGFIRASRLPTGFMRITRTVAEQVWAAETVEYLHRDGKTRVRYVFSAGPENGLWWSEDFTFCRKWRRLGGELWLAADVTLQHVYPHAHEGNYQRDYLDRLAVEAGATGAD